MQDHEWRQFLVTARRILGEGASLSWGSESWCAWTTFSSLEHGLVYWHCGLPNENELLESRTVDGGTWGQIFNYSEIAHFAIPAKFYWDRMLDGQYAYGTKTQDLERLSQELKHLGIRHRKTELVLEIKLY